MEYLQVLGVDVWLPRRPNAAAAPTEAPLPAPSLPSPSHPATAFAFEDPAAVEPVARPSTMPREQSAPSTAHERLSSAPLFAPPVGPPVPQPPRIGDAEAEALWSALKSEVAVCTKCALHSSRTQTVFGVGDQKAGWLVIGEAPGAEEDKRGEPFVGRGGQLLDSMLRGIGLKRGDNVYIANILKSRPPGNRDPKPEEVAACLPFLMRQIALIQPKIILAVGRIAAQNILQTAAPLARLRGKVHHFGELNTPLIVTYHPAYLLRSPGEKRKAWEDLKFARGLYRQLTLGESPHRQA